MREKNPGGVLPVPVDSLARARSRKKRFLMVSVAGLAVLGVAMGVSFLGSSGSVSLSVSTAGSSNYVFPVANSASLPGGTNFVNKLQYTGTGGVTIAGSGANTTSTITNSGAVLPNWLPSANSAGSVTTAGDLAVIDTSGASNTVLVNMFVTNLPALQLSYSSFALKVGVYSADCNAGSCSWTANTTVLPSAVFLTNTEGFLSFNLPSVNSSLTGKARYFDVTIESGGSYYTICTDTSGTCPGGSLSPSFYFTAQPS